jgi:hypothetical protein
MCREFGGFDATVLESTAASTLALDTDWRPIQDGAAVAVMAEATARAVRPADLAVFPVLPPPQYVVALAWRAGEQVASVQRLLDHLRSYRDKHGWTAGPGLRSTALGHTARFDQPSNLTWLRHDKDLRPL